MTIGDQIIRNAVMRHAQDVERSLERLVSDGVPLEALTITRTVETVDCNTVRLSTAINLRDGREKRG